MLWISLSGLTEVILGPVDNLVEHFFHKVNIAVMDMDHVSALLRSLHYKRIYPKQSPSPTFSPFPCISQLCFTTQNTYTGIVSYSGFAEGTRLKDDSLRNYDLQLCTSKVQEL